MGEGLPSIPAKLQERILHWEYIDFADLRPLGASGFEVSNPETGPQKLIVLPGMEVTKQNASQWILSWGDSKPLVFL